MPAAACHDAAAAATAPIGRNRPVCTAWRAVDRPPLVPVRPLTITRKYASAAVRPTSFKVKVGGQAVGQHQRHTAQHMTRPHGLPHPNTAAAALQYTGRCLAAAARTSVTPACRAQQAAINTRAIYSNQDDIAIRPWRPTTGNENATLMA